MDAFFIGVSVILFIVTIAVYRSYLSCKQTRDMYKGHAKNLEDRFKAAHVESIENGVEKLKILNKRIEDKEHDIDLLNTAYNQLFEKEVAQAKKVDDLTKKVENQKLKLQKTKDLYTAMDEAIRSYYTASLDNTGFKLLSESQVAEIDMLAPSVLLSLNSMNYQDLRKKFLNNQKQIEEVLNAFTERYSTKTTKSLYQVMVIALKAELQNILTKLKYSKLEEGIQSVREVINKYIFIAEEGNQTIAGTVKQFAYTIEKLFEDAVNIEYEYYIKKEQAHQEQLALKARMREEREEQRRLKEEAERMKKEEEKYLQEKERLEARLQEAQTEEDMSTITNALDQLSQNLAEIDKKKEEIATLQHGKAGNVYIISNLGSFGDHVFKIGMTRRLDPQERIDELGSASVPFEFDVHSFIFSDDASTLETELHKRLNEKRVNKVNKRKEFFDVSLDELESLVNEIYPTAEFNRTMLAEEYRQSQSLSQNAFTFDDENQTGESEEDIEEARN